MLRLVMKIKFKIIYIMSAFVSRYTYFYYYYYYTTTTSTTTTTTTTATTTTTVGPFPC